MAALSALRQIGPATYELSTRFRKGMRVPVRVFASDKLVREMDDQVFAQAVNVAKLPGIVGASFCMPDAHWGYGFPIGGVAATDPDEAQRNVLTRSSIDFATFDSIGRKTSEREAHM